MIDSLLERFGQHDRRALARLLTMLARGRHIDRILSGLGPVGKPSRVVAITGSGGVGKSTLVGKLVDLVRGRDLSIAVLACDPQSAVTGGALLGDRLRMPHRPDDDGVFIRSLAAPGGQGALARHVGPMIGLLEAYGFDVIMIETAGAGQGDTAVHALVDVVVLLLQPETGDDVQWEKAGLLEIADVVVIHKADLPGAETVEAQLRTSLALPGARIVPVVHVSARSGAGLERLWQLIENCPLRRGTHSRDAPALLRLVQDSLAARFDEALAAGDHALNDMIAMWQERRLSQDDAVTAVLHRFGNPSERDTARADANRGGKGIP